MILEIILISIICFLTYIYWQQTFSEFAIKLNKFPGKKIIPIFGNILELPKSTGIIA